MLSLRDTTMHRECDANRERVFFAPSTSYQRHTELTSIGVDDGDRSRVGGRIHIAFASLVRIGGKHGHPKLLRLVHKIERPELVRGIKRSEEHTSELQSLMRISYAVFCLKKKNTRQQNNQIVSRAPHTHHTTKLT